MYTLSTFGCKCTRFVRLVTNIHAQYVWLQVYPLSMCGYKCTRSVRVDTSVHAQYVWLQVYTLCTCGYKCTRFVRVVRQGDKAQSVRAPVVSDVSQGGL